MFPPSTLYGQIAFALTPPKLHRRARSIPRITQRWQAATHDAYAIGDDFPDSGEITGIENMRVVEIDPDIEIVGSACELSLTGEGIPDASWMELGRQNQSPEVGWDVCALEIYTRDLSASRWTKGQRLKEDAITSISVVASTDTFTKSAHGLVTGQLLESFTFGSGFGGLTSGSNYFVIKLTADTFKLAATRANADAGTAINITSDGTGATATPLVFGHELMFITGRSDRPADAKDYHHLDLEIKGLLQRSGDSKAVVRQWETASGRYSTKFDGAATLSGTNFTGFPPVSAGTTSSLSGTDINVEYAIPALRVTDTMVTTTQPEANWLYQFWTPDNAPSVTLFTLSAQAETYNFPYGWRLAGMNVQPIPGQSIWLLSLTWEYVAPSTPKAV